MGIQIDTIRQGVAEISFDSKKNSFKQIEEILKRNGMSLIKTREQKFVEKFKIFISAG